MGKMPDELRETIARNIRACRFRKFPGRGGGKKCAEDFGVSPQQWSPWETGKRTPDEIRLQQIADFFGVTVEYLRRDNSKPPPTPPPVTDSSVTDTLEQTTINTAGRIPGIDIPPLPGWQPDPPGSPASFFWLARHFLSHLQTGGLRLDKQCLDYIANAIKRPPH